MEDLIVFSFDNLDILGVFGENVFLRGINDSEEEIVIQLTQKQFHDSLDCWLNDKRSFCERYNHYCGSMGQITSNDYEITETTK